jgi:molybdopterin synthase catalytic subunit
MVLWEEVNEVVIDFELNYEPAFKKLLQLTKKAGKEKEVLDIIHAADNYLIRKPSYSVVVSGDHFQIVMLQ